MIAMLPLRLWNTDASGAAALSFNRYDINVAEAVRERTGMNSGYDATTTTIVFQRKDHMVSM